MSEHGFCPNCHVDLDGGSIWEHFFHETGSASEADRIAGAYGATRTTGQWAEKIGLYSWEEDRTVKWQCPDCGHEWPR